VEPSEEALDFPAAAVTTQFAAVLGAVSTAIVLVGRDESDAVFLQQALVERITIVGAVADHSFRLRSRKPLRDGGFNEFGFMGRSAIAMILLPLPRRVGPTAAPTFSPN